METWQAFNTVAGESLWDRGPISGHWDCISEYRTQCCNVPKYNHRPKIGSLSHRLSPADASISPTPEK